MVLMEEKERNSILILAGNSETQKAVNAALEDSNAMVYFSRSSFEAGRTSFYKTD